MRKLFIAGNWKMNQTSQDAREFLKALRNEDLPKDVEGAICAPFTSLHVLKDGCEELGIGLGAQNMHYEASGAFTGEVSPLMLKDLGVDYVILGHSERRQIFKEDDELINQKLKSAINHDLKPILCVGESLEERKAGKAQERVEAQLEVNLQDLSEEEGAKLVIAYEPIWAIGTGEVASAEDAQSMCQDIRAYLATRFNQGVADQVRILYGGSVKPDNVKEIVSQPDIDGALVGGASLKAVDFSALLRA